MVKRVHGSMAPRRDLGRAAAGDDAAVVEDREPVAELLGLVHVVRRQHDGRPRGPQAAHQLPGVGTGTGVHPRGRLVEEQEPRPADERSASESRCA